MRFVITKEILATPLAIIAGVVDRKQTLPIIGNILLETRNNQLFMIATNLEVELRCHQALPIEVADVRTTIPAQKFKDIVKSLAKGTVIECEINEGQFNLSTPTAKFSLTVLPAEDFPLMKDSSLQVPEVSFSVKEKVLRHAINKCAFSMALEDVRYYLNGMLFEIDNNLLTLVTTDGHRMSVVREDIQYLGEKKRVIIPRKGVYEMLRVLDDNEENIELVIQGNNIRVKTNIVEFQCKLIDGEYPSYHPVLPPQVQYYFDVETESFIKAVERTGIILNEKPRGTKIILEPGNMTVLTTNSIKEKSSEKVAIDYQGMTVELGFSTDYLGETFRQIETSHSRISFNNPDESCWIEEIDGDRSKFLVMSMKV